MAVVQIVFQFLFPYLMIRLAGDKKKLGLMSPILICYIVGMLLGNLPYLPIDKGLSMTISEISIPLAIPLILFSADFIKWLHLARKTLLAFCLVTAGVALASAAGALLLGDTVDEYWKLSGMLAGLYTGGTPNLMAIGMGLDVRQETLLLANASDAVLGGVYLLFLLTGAKWLFGKLLPPSADQTGIDSDITASQKGTPLQIALLFGLSALFVATAIGISLLFTRKVDVAIVMLVITSLGIAASFVKKVRSVNGAYDAGQYFILVFSLSLGTNADFTRLISASPSIFIYTAFVMFVSVIFILILSALFRIDVDTMILTSTAGIYGPAFIPPVAAAIKNRDGVIAGLTCGIIGYAIGNYLGFLMAWLLMPR